MRFVLGIVLAIAVGAWSSAALAQKRIALLIGNKDYKPGVGTLVNPLNDIRVVGEALKAVGFEVLKPVHNARRTDMLLAVHDFAGKLKAAGPDAVGFLYYSGHGIASSGENYLIPVDVEEPSTRLLGVQGVRQSEVLATLRNEAPNAAHYLVLDACRNNLQGARGGKGFVPVGQQSGVLVAFAAEPGKTASDTGQGSGPYAAALATELVKPGQIDLVMFHNVRVSVIQKTGGDQVPWTEDGIQRPQRTVFAGEQVPISLPTPRSSPDRWPTESPSRTLPVPVGVFYKGQTSAQSLASKGPLVGMTIVDPAGYNLGTVQYIMFETNAVIGVVFNYGGKPVGVRINSPHVRRDDARRRFILNLEHAHEILTVLQPYRIVSVDRPAPATSVGR